MNVMLYSIGGINTCNILNYFTKTDYTIITNIKNKNNQCVDLENVEMESTFPWLHHMHCLVIVDNQKYSDRDEIAELLKYCVYFLACGREILYLLPKGAKPIPALQNFTITNGKAKNLVCSYYHTKNITTKLSYFFESVMDGSSNTAGEECKYTLRLSTELYAALQTQALMANQPVSKVIRRILYQKLLQ